MPWSAVLGVAGAATKFMKNHRNPSFLYVCLGNICRSPTVEAVARTEFARAGLSVEVASAGTAGYHVGHGADPRSVRFAAAHGYDLSGHRARQFRREDFAAFDHVLAMDRENLRELRSLAPADAVPMLFLGDAEVPDPYDGGDEDFEQVIALARSGVAAWIARLRG